MLKEWRQERGEREEVELGESQGEEGTSEPGSNDVDGGGDDDSDGQDEEESDSESELLLQQTLKKQQYRKRKRRQSGDGDSDPETVTGEIPVDILKRISPLCEKMGLSMRDQLFLTMGFCQLCGKSENLATCWFTDFLSF